MTEVSIIGPDLAKNVFQAHGAAADGTVVFRRRLSRAWRRRNAPAPPPFQPNFIDDEPRGNRRRLSDRRERARRSAAEPSADPIP